MMTRGNRSTTKLAKSVATIASVLMLALAFSTSGMAAEPLKVCADPDNLPFSKSEGPERGLYIELAELVAKKLDATPVEYTWWLTYFQRRALRNTAGDCDAVFALPTDADYKARGLQKTPAFLEVGYALVSSPSFQFNGLNELKGKRLAVQYQTTPHILLSQIEGYTYTTYRSADEVFEALVKGEVDASFLWGPVAGYENQRRFSGRWKVTPLTGSDMSGQVSVAVRRDKPELAKSIEAALAALKPEIEALASKYGFPRSKPVNIAQVGLELTRVANNARIHDLQSQTKKSNPMIVKVQHKPVPETKTATVEPSAPVVATATESATGDKATLGRVRFNDQCSHCHGSDGVSPVRERDVRRLNMRYDAKWRELALTTIKNGRSDLGMPPWKDVFGEAEILQLLSFLETIQK
jgi:polar amino acid transport system substrate-binding protein